MSVAGPTATPSPAPSPPIGEAVVVDRVEVLILESFPVQDATDWGTGGRDEALLFIAQVPDGGYAWHGVLTAFGGFAPELPAISWHREGGIVGFCDSLELYGNGNVYARSCATNPLQSSVHARLPGERLAQLETWVTGLRSFEFEQSTCAVADAMTVRLTFQGAGSSEESEAQVQSMLDLSCQVFAALWHVGETETRYVIALQGVAMLSGPGKGYEEIRQVAAGQTAFATGVSADGSWWRVICPDDTVGSCWLPADPQQTEPTRAPPHAPLGGGLLVTFDVDGERFHAWVTNPTTIQQILDLQQGKSQATIPNGRILRGPGLGGYNLP